MKIKKSCSYCHRIAELGSMYPFAGELVCDDCWILLHIRRSQLDYIEIDWLHGIAKRVTIDYAEKELEKRGWKEG